MWVCAPSYRTLSRRRNHIREKTLNFSVQIFVNLLVKTFFKIFSGHFGLPGRGPGPGPANPGRPKRPENANLRREAVKKCVEKLGDTPQGVIQKGGEKNG